MIIEFGDWRLVPMDDHNWELCHRHAATRGKNAGQVQWNRMHRYYQYNTLDCALLFAADFELKEKREGRVAEIGRALEEYRAIVGALRADVLEALGKTA